MLHLAKQFPEKRAFITGAGSGLGRAMCEQLANDKWTIGISDINETGLQETAQSISKKGGKPIAYLFDVADKDAYQRAAIDFLSQAGGIDFLVNNAGVGEGSPFEKYSLENWQWLVGINQMGVIYGCHFFIPQMKKQQSGHILNISSIASISNAPRMSGYNVTKAAVKSLSETLYAELKADNIKVSVAMPFFFRTNIAQHARGDKDSKETAEYMVKGARRGAEEIAGRILKQTGKGKFYILEPFEAKVFFHFQRLFPNWFLKLNAKMASRADKMKAMAKRRYDKKQAELSGK